MQSAQQPDFIVIEDGTIHHVAAELEAGNGIVIVADPEYAGSPADMLWGDFEIHLFDHPTIEFRRHSTMLVTKRGSEKRGSEECQTGWENDREYRLTPRPKPRTKRANDDFYKQLARLYGQPDNLDELYEQVDHLFERLIVGDYEFTIGFQASTGFDLGYKRARSLYVPRSASPQAALRYALNWMTDLWNAHTPPKGWPPHFKFQPEHVAAMVVYMLDDLRTGRVLQHNVGAGRMADAMTGLA